MSFFEYKYIWIYLLFLWDIFNFETLIKEQGTTRFCSMFMCDNAHCAYVLLVDAVCVRHTIWRGCRSRLFGSFMSRKSGNFSWQRINNSKMNFYLIIFLSKCAEMKEGRIAGNLCMDLCFTLSIEIPDCSELVIRTNMSYKVRILPIKISLSNAIFYFSQLNQVLLGKRIRFVLYLLIQFKGILLFEKSDWQERFWTNAHQFDSSKQIKLFNRIPWLILIFLNLK